MTQITFMYVSMDFASQPSSDTSRRADKCCCPFQGCHCSLGEGTCVEPKTPEFRLELGVQDLVAGWVRCCSDAQKNPAIQKDYAAVMIILEP